MLNKISTILIILGIIFGILGYLSSENIMLSRSQTYTICNISFMFMIIGNILGLITAIIKYKKDKQ
ncbi:hypothetical protein DWV06_06815 [Anaerosacchariphilus polymeriproducens]|uniref:Uncharacterized protein n=1 Tax=Anaerosacchariphilus polymeriproducens TaxID=1812858 RepID=A0A371AWQ3_9FIRM|nr:hypothetical protein DWV06_06815 [Anaerosacchariphilus polymeriproducens]